MTGREGCLFRGALNLGLKVKIQKSEWKMKREL
jgi:hypothetical protein